MHFILIVYLILVQNEKGNDITHGAREIYFNIVTEITFLISITINMVHESWDLKRNCEHRIYRVYKIDYIYCWKVYNWKRYADFALTIVNSWNLRVSIYISKLQAQQLEAPFRACCLNISYIYKGAI